MANNNSYIFNEQASWLVNWINKVFTLVNSVSSIESLRIGYVEYTNFTFSWNTITLNDAPTVINWGVFVDYFYEASTSVFDSVNLIYDEQTIWDADWTNRVFYSIYPIGHIEELRVNWVSYTSFTINGRAITLASAPSAILWAPRIDYFRSDVDMNTIDSGVTLSQLRSSIYQRIWHTVTSLQFPATLVDEYIVEWVQRISKMKRDKKKRGIFSFHKAYDSQIVSTDGNSINIGTPSMYLPSKGIAIIENWDVLTYSSKSSTSIGSINWLDINDIWGFNIQFGYKLSKNIEKISEVFVNWFKLLPSDFAEYRYKKNKDSYCVYNNYLFLPFWMADGQVVTVVYLGKNTTVYTDTDIIDFDGDYLPVIKTFVLWNMYHDREDDREIKEQARYKEILKEYKRELSKQYENTSWTMQTASPLNKW